MLSIGDVASTVKDDRVRCQVRISRQRLLESAVGALELGKTRTIGCCGHFVFFITVTSTWAVYICLWTALGGL